MADAELPSLLGDKFVPMTWGGPSEPSETSPQTLCRVRRRLAAAGTRNGRAWEELFALCDRNRDGTLDYKELSHLVRQELKIPMQTVCDYELRVLFGAVDKDGSGNVDAAELIEYIQHGPRRPQDDAARSELRIQRVRRNMRLAFQAVGGSELDSRKIFSYMDMDSSNKLSMYEFESFVRNDLGLTRWDVQNASLQDFFAHLDRNGDGLDVNELLAFLRQAQKDKAALGPQSLYQAPRVPTLDRKRKTHRQKLHDSLHRSSSLPSLRVHTSAFTNLGRERLPMSRLVV